MIGTIALKKTSHAHLEATIMLFASEVMKQTHESNTRLKKLWFQWFGFFMAPSRMLIAGTQNEIHKERSQHVKFKLKPEYPATRLYTINRAHTVTSQLIIQTSSVVVKCISDSINYIKRLTAYQVNCDRFRKYQEHNTSTVQSTVSQDWLCTIQGNK